MSNLIPITKIYAIYLKYTFSKDVMRFMNDIVDIPTAEAYTKDEVIEVLEGTLKEILEEADNYNDGTYCCINVIQERINALRGEENDGKNNT